MIEDAANGLIESLEQRLIDEDASGEVADRPDSMA